MRERTPHQPTSIQVLLVTGSEYTVEHKTFENKLVMPNCRVWLSFHLLFSAYQVSSIRRIFAYHLHIQVHAFINQSVRYIYLITRLSMQYSELLHEWAWYFHEP